jgi:hypothetical protein
MSSWIVRFTLPGELSKEEKLRKAILEINDRITDGGRWEMHFPPLKTKEEEIKELIKCLFVWKKN